MRNMCLGLVCLMVIAGCNAAGSANQARSICESVGVPAEVVTEAIELAQEDRAEGLSAAESKELFDGDCADICGEDEECISDCTTCFYAVVDAVY